MAKKAKKKSVWRQLIAILIMMGIGAACGVLIGMLIGRDIEDASAGTLCMIFGGMLAAIYIATYVQTVVHEAGHLAFGLMTGYRFSSFRIGSMMWLKENGRMVRKRFSLAGTGGQCLMAPPEPDGEGMIPVVLYNLGGSIMNLIFGAVCMGLRALWSAAPAWNAFWTIMALVGLGTALVNGVPMRLGTVDNDGYNALMLRRNGQAVRAFRLQMKMNDMIARGVRPKDMPEEWFMMPEDADMRNSMVAAVAVMACSRLMDAHRFEEAEEQMRRILAMESGIIGVHRAQLVCERAYCELIGQCRRDEIIGMLDKGQRKMMKAMKSLPSVARLEYAAALLLDGDEDKAEQAKARFEKIALKYPYPADIESERELMEIAKKRAGERSQGKEN